MVVVNKAIAADWIHAYIKCILHALQWNKNLLSTLRSTSIISIISGPLFGANISPTSPFDLCAQPIVVYSSRHLIWAQNDMLYLQQILFRQDNDEEGLRKGIRKI